MAGDSKAPAHPPQTEHHGFGADRRALVDVDIDRVAAGCYGLARYPISLRYPREWRDSVAALQALLSWPPA